MNRGVLQLQSSPVMAGGNPNLHWNVNGMRPLTTTQSSSPFMVNPNSYLSSGGHPYYAPVSSFPFQPVWHDNQELPESLSQLMIMGGLVGEEGDKNAVDSNFQANKLRVENWEEQVFLHSSPNSHSSIDVKQEDSASSYVYSHANTGDNYHSSATKSSNWAPVVSASSPKSCVTSLSTGVLDFSSKKTDGRHPPPDRTSEGDSIASGGAPKKAKVQPSSSQSTFKVRKEKLGDRISALHQLVSPFGKTDTASVLLEAIGYIRFLQNQIEALSLPYLGNAPGRMRHPHSVRGERDCIFPEDPGQLLNGNCMKRKLVAPEQDSSEEPRRDLRSRGLCLVPVSCTLQVGSDNGADYWASAFGGGFR